MANQAYMLRVSAAAKKRDGSPIYNGSVEHARIIVENLLSHADTSVDLISSELNARIYGVDRVVEEASIFLATPDRKMRIIVEDVDLDDLEDHPLYRSIKQNANVEIRKMRPIFSQATDFNFMVVDGNSYRYEEDKTRCAAVAAWGDVTAAANLQSVFNELWVDGTISGHEQAD